MSEQSYLELAQELGLKVADLRTFLEAHGLRYPPDEFNGQQRTQINSLFSEWCDRPRLVPLRLVARQVGIDPEQYLQYGRNSGLRWLNTTSSRMSSPHAKGLNDWLVRAGLLATSPTDWPPPVEHDALTWMSENSSWEVIEVVQGNEQQSHPPSALQQKISALASEELGNGAKGHNYFLLRLMDRMTSDPLVRDALSRDGVPLSTLVAALEAVSGVPKPRKGHTFKEDVYWAVVRSRRGNLSELWVADGEVPTARLVFHKRESTRWKRFRREVDSRDGYQVGEIRWVQFHESRRGRRSELHHPAVIVEKAGANKWRVLSLTTEVEGDPEGRRVPRHCEQGLDYAGYVWHEVQKVFVSEIGDHIGWVHPELVVVIRRNVSMRQVLLDQLAEVGAEKHPQSDS